MIWYIENPLRHRREREAIDALVSLVNWLRPGEWRIDSSVRLICDADILVGNRSFPVSLRYPSYFPHSPPVVLPREVTERWSSHQYGDGGELCLEFGPDNWHPDLTGADMLQSAYRLLEGEWPATGESGRVASRHATTLGQDLRGHSLRLLLTRSLTELIRSFSVGEMRQGTLTIKLRDRVAIYVVKSVTMPAGEKWFDEAVPSVLSEEGWEQPVGFLRWPAEANLPPVESLADFRAAIAAQGIDLPDVTYAVVARGADIHAYLLWKDDNTATRIAVIPAQPATARLDEGHLQLKERRIALVGCGSLGSKLAGMLARAGVGRFLLIDDDIMLPDNFVRHELDWREVGMHKVAGVARRIHLVNSSAQCDTRGYSLGGQESSGSIEMLIETISKCNLIVDASADARVFNYLCAAVEIGKKPLVWAEVFGGGFGGLIARHRHGIEPNPATMRRRIENWCAEQGKPIERAVQDYETRRSGPPLIADDADVTVLAAHAARLAIDTLISRKPSMFPHSVYLIGLAEGWIFDQPFDTRPIDVGPPLPESATEPIDERIAAEERAQILTLFKKFSDAASSDSADS